MLFMSTRIVSTGSYVPEVKVSNTDLESIMDTNDEWIRKRTGIESRRYEDISTVRMATEAAKDACSTVDVETLDCIVVATYTPDSFIPTVANQVKANLGITRPIPSFDVNAACSGFIYAYQVAHAYIVSGIYRRVLVIGVDFNSRYMNFEDRSTSILFGDGAGALVLETSDKGTIDTIIGGEDDINESITMKNSTDYSNPFVERDTQKESYFEMKGSDVFKYAVRIMDKTIKDLLVKNNLETNDIDYVLSHQANQRILDSGARSLKIDTKRMLSNVSKYGNTSSASVPILLDEANKKGLLQSGMKVILVAFGGGLTYGAVLLEWI